MNDSLDSLLNSVTGVCGFGTVNGLEIFGRGCFARSGANFMSQLDFRAPGAFTRVPVRQDESLCFYLPAPAQPEQIVLVGQVQFARDDAGRDGFFGFVAAARKQYIMQYGFAHLCNIVDQMCLHLTESSTYKQYRRIDVEDIKEQLPDIEYNDMLSGTAWSSNFSLHEFGLPAGWRRKVTPSILFPLINHFENEFLPLIQSGYVLRETLDPDQEWQLPDAIIDSWYQTLVGRAKAELAEARGRVDILNEELKSAVRVIEAHRHEKNKLYDVINKVENLINSAAGDAIMEKDKRIAVLGQEIEQLKSNLRDAENRVTATARENQEWARYLSLGMQMFKDKLIVSAEEKDSTNVPVVKNSA